jgi:hypothetical protein
MTRRRHRSAKQASRGVWLAFLAVAMQVLVPFFLMVEIARANEPDGPTVICSSFGHAIHQDNGNTADHGLTAHCCSICTALAAAQGLAPPAAPPLPLPVSLGRSDLTSVGVARSALLLTSSYRSRGPPAIA